MVMVFVLLAAIPACLVWVWKHSLLAALVVWAACIAEMFVWFAWATALPLEMLLPMQGFLIFIGWWTWHCFCRRPKPLPQIILSQPYHPSPFHCLGSYWRLRIAPWLSVLLLVGICVYLATAWINGSSSPYKTPEDVQRSKDVMDRNTVSNSDPAAAFRQSENQQQPAQAPPQPPQNWSATDDLNDWGRYVKP